MSKTAAKPHKLMVTRNFVEFVHFMIDLFGEVASLSLKLQVKALILLLPFHPLTHALILLRA